MRGKKWYLSETPNNLLGKRNLFIKDVSTHEDPQIDHKLQPLTRGTTMIITTRQTSSTHKIKVNKTLTIVECTMEMMVISSMTISSSRIHSLLCRTIRIMKRWKEKILITTNKSTIKCLMIHFLTISSNMQTLVDRKAA